MSDDFQDIFDDVDKIYQRFAKRMFREMEDIEEDIKSGKLEGEWDIKPIEEPGVKGYVARGRFEFGNKPKQKSLTLPKEIPQEAREPLTDVFQDEDNIKLYIELPGVEKDDIKFNVSEGKAEIKAKNFHKTIDLPTPDVEATKTKANYKNGVLEVTIPKKKQSQTEREKEIIKIE
ncbi:MAG TPA: Hsp20/alpha crystallin family protein [Candidatus Bathyarchaeia archaeon]|nr:Hsp20/alpha crystallin family protein [Candidatus Bathyarchaeia archaeon]